MPAAIPYSQHTRLYLFAAVYTLLTLLGFFLMFGPGPLLLSHWFQPPAIAASAPVAPQKPVATVNQPAVQEQEGQLSPDVIDLESSKQFKELIRGNDVILYLDCGWAFETVHVRKHYNTFATWCRQNTDYLPLRLMFDGNDPYLPEQDWLEIRDVLKASSVQGRKQPGAIIWLRDGIVRQWLSVDFQWNQNYLIHYTRKAFDPTYEAAQPPE